MIIDIEFEWDPNKAATNYAKHGITFEQARLAFVDIFAIEVDDCSEDYGEGRYVLTGMAKDKLLVVVYTEREDRIRIISAREAENYERTTYYQSNQRNW